MSRIEQDALGRLRVPYRAYYGIQTMRAVANFPVSGLRAHPDLIRAYVLVKKAAALTNHELGRLDAIRARAIVRACDEVLTGSLADQFPVDVFQAGAGTSLNMNVNEVLANRALGILRRPRGEYARLSPNDHVNLAQSSNDTFPTAVHLAVVFGADRLLSALAILAQTLARKGREFRRAMKSGRTHLNDALPVTLGAEFKAYAAVIDRAAGRLRQRRNDLLELPIGGTAVGSGVGTHPGYRRRVLRELGRLCDLGLRPARDSYEALQSRSQLVAFSGALRELALELIRIANDLRLLASGPSAGLAEIELPAVQPGSSIMPGKVNPVLAECLDMVGFQVVGNDVAVSLAAQAGQLELNVMSPVMAHNILQSLTILGNFLPVFTTKCLAGVKADAAKCRKYLGLNPSLATLLVPRVGYLQAAWLAQEAAARKVPVAELAVEQGILSPAEARRLFRPENITGERRPLLNERKK
jgi:aspartate ammonia-lyase